MKTRSKYLIIIVVIALSALLVFGCTQDFVSPSPFTPNPTEFSPVPPLTASATASAFPLPTTTDLPNPQITPAVEKNDVTATTEPQFTLQITTIETTHPMTRVRAIAWDTNSLAIRYALGDELADEPGDWVWWRYELNTDVKEPLPAPVSHVSDAIRAQLGLCTESDPDCWSQTVLYESPSGTQMAFGPIGSQGEYGTGELWIANVDGTNRRQIPVPLYGIVEWSLQEDYLLVDTGWDWPDAYLVQVDNLSVHRLLDLVGLKDCAIPQAAPHFSPDGKKIIFAGNQFSEGNERCSLWEVDTNGDNLRRLSEHVGGVQWSKDPQVLYILEHRYKSRNTQEFTLYRLDAHPSSPQVELLAEELPYYGFLTRFAPWAVSPDETMIAYTDASKSETLCNVRFAPIP